MGKNHSKSKSRDTEAFIKSLKRVSDNVKSKRSAKKKVSKFFKKDQSQLPH